MFVRYFGGVLTGLLFRAVSVLATNSINVSGRERLRGTVTGGIVMWPVVDESYGCGDGVALIEAGLKRGRQSGSFTGCLGNIHYLLPKVWGDMASH